MKFEIVLLVVILVLLVLDYCLLVIAGEEEERADRMYRKWKENGERKESEW